jgi:hypothetical protein
MPDRYPLSWPAGRPRKEGWKRRYGVFKEAGVLIGMASAADRLDDELRLLGAKYALLSTDVPLIMRGGFGSTRGVYDPGACVYFNLKDKRFALACDTFTTTPQNIAALAAHVHATRAIERHGVASAAETLEAFEALPPPKPQVRERPWWEVLGLVRERATAEIVGSVYRAMAKEAHANGSLVELNVARDTALAELGA